VSRVKLRRITRFVLRIRHGNTWK